VKGIIHAGPSVGRRLTRERNDAKPEVRSPNSFSAALRLRVSALNAVPRGIAHVRPLVEHHAA
jgi:hypothetical protein